MEVIFVDYRHLNIIKARPRCGGGAKKRRKSFSIVNLDMVMGGSSHLDNDIVNVKGELSLNKTRVVYTHTIV